MTDDKPALLATTPKKDKEWEYIKTAAARPNE